MKYGESDSKNKRQAVYEYIVTAQPFVCWSGDRKITVPVIFPYISLQFLFSEITHRQGQRGTALRCLSLPPQRGRAGGGGIAQCVRRASADTRALLDNTDRIKSTVRYTVPTWGGGRGRLPTPLAWARRMHSV